MRFFGKQDGTAKPGRNKERKSAGHAPQAYGRCSQQGAEREAELASDGEDAHAGALLRTSHQVGQASSFGVEHRNADAAYHGCCKVKLVVGHHADKRYAGACQENAHRHKPRPLVPVAKPTEQGLDYG